MTRTLMQDDSSKSHSPQQAKIKRQNFRIFYGGGKRLTELQL